MPAREEPGSIKVSRYVVPEPGTVVLGIHAGTKNRGAWYPGTRNCGVCYLGTRKHVARYQKQEPWCSVPRNQEPWYPTVNRESAFGS